MSNVYLESLLGYRVRNGAVSLTWDMTIPGNRVQATTTEHVVGGSRGRLSDVWLLVPLGLLSLIVIIPVAVFTRQWWNDRRVRRRNRESPSKQLPPLPRRDPR